MTNQPKLKEAWEKEFDKFNEQWEKGGYLSMEELKFFIRSLLSQERQEAREEFAKKIRIFTASGEYLSEKEFKRGYDARDKELEVKINQALKERRGR